MNALPLFICICKINPLVYYLSSLLVINRSARISRCNTVGCLWVFFVPLFLVISVTNSILKTLFSIHWFFLFLWRFLHSRKLHFLLLTQKTKTPFQMTASPRHSSMERRGIPTGELLLNKLEEVNKSVKVNTVSLLIYGVWSI